MSVVEMCEKIFLLSEVNIKFSVEQYVFIVRIYYAAKSYKKSAERIYDEVCWGFINSNDSSCNKFCLWQSYEVQKITV